MPFELSIASKYLLPRWRQLSVSLISLVSVCVIALVVWLILVFFSVTRGLENNWIQQLIALTAPVRITPTEQYYDSYYYQADQYSEASDYQAKNFQAKLESEDTDPWDPSIDPQLPSYIPDPVLQDGQLVDIIKEAFEGIQTVGPKWQVAPYEMSRANLRVRQLRESGRSLTQRSSEQPSYIVSFSEKNPLLHNAMLPLDSKDLANLIWIAGISDEGVLEEALDSVSREESQITDQRIATIFEHVELKSLKVGSGGWRPPVQLYPLNVTLKVRVVWQDQHPSQLVIDPNGDGLFKLEDGIPFLEVGEERIALTARTIVVVGEGTEIPVTGRPTSEGVPIRLEWDGMTLEGSVPLAGLELGDVEWKTQFDKEPTNPPPWLHFVDGMPRLPEDDTLGEGMLLAKHFKEEADTRVGDRGSLSYYAITPSGLQEQRSPFYVAGFYDPGIIPIGGKFVMVSAESASTIRVGQGESEVPEQGGIHVWFPDVKKAGDAKQALLAEFDSRGLTPYFKIETYEEYDFTKELIQQLSSEQNLFSLISLIIIVVACSNIITLLILLVNDKRLEIGILRSMGASKLSIAIIFGTCGVVMGGLGSVVGAIAAILTLIYLHPIINFLSWIQGYELFSTSIYGKLLPNELSFEVLGVVVVVTVVLSLLSGVIPALKATWMNPSNILRS